MDRRKWLPLMAAAVLAVGCSVSPEDQLVGIWSMGDEAQQLPKAPFPEAEERLKDLTRNFRLKLLSDRTFVLTSVGMVEGTWSYKNGTLELKPKKGGTGNWVRGATIHVAPNLQTMEIAKTTMVGDIKVRLRKTG